MEIITSKDFFAQKEYFIRKAEQGAIFIYPTDSVYGIGAIFNQENINKIAQIKQRDPAKPVSIVAPNWGWIQMNFDVDLKGMQYKYEEHKPCTFIVPTGKDFYLPSFNNSLGIRIIDHKFQEFVNELGHPFITTSVNISGEANITDINQIDESISKKVNFIVNEGILNNHPSTLIDLENDEIIKR